MKKSSILSCIVVGLSMVTLKNFAQELDPIDDFHMVMAESFHPLMDSSNLDPALALADQLEQKAEAWCQSTLSSKRNSIELKSALEKLVETTKKFAAMAKAKIRDENELVEVLNDIHEQFHQIMKIWY